MLLAVATLLACADEPPGESLDGAVGDMTLISDMDPNPGETGSPLSTPVDFVVQGCANTGAKTCTGAPPLTLTFSAVLALGGGATVSWDFGDKSSSPAGILVSHTYAEPGTYDVTLNVAEPGGTVSEEKEGFVVVAAAEPAGKCESDASCASKRCACQKTAAGVSTCDFPLDSGICLQVCKGAPCPVRSGGGQGYVCAKLGEGSTSSPRPEWRTELCLAGCLADDACQRPGFVCKMTPAGSGWARACVPPGLEEVASACRTPAGVRDDSRCLGGACLDMGAGGYCTASCQAGGCPEGTRCVQFTGSPGKPVCLSQCKGTIGCANDPFLACEAPAAEGVYGFAVLGAPPAKGAKFCAPKRCKADPECGLAGVCKPMGGGFCRSK